MTPDQFTIVTALTIASIGAILFIYLIVLKRKGWLTEEIQSDASYICPNQQCRKIFQKPITLTDLSVSPPRSYLGCPHCGLDLATISLPKPEKLTKLDKTIAKKPTLPMEHAIILSESQRPATHATPADTGKRSAPEPHRSMFPFRNSKKSGKADKLEAKQTAQTLRIADEQPPKPAADKQKIEKDQKLSLRPSECTHFFGYIKRLPKNAPIPDECIGCAQLVKCLTGEGQIEA